MKPRKLVSKIVGTVLVTLLSAMIFNVAASLAEDLAEGGEASLFNATEPSETFTAKLTKPGLLLVPGRNLTVVCSAVTVENGIFQSDKEALAEVKFSGCSAWTLSQTEEVAGCTVSNGKTITAKAVVLPTKHNGESFLLFESDAGAPFATVEFESGKGCALPLKNEVKGTLGALAKETEGVIQSISLNESVQTLLGDAMLFGTFKAVADGEVTIVELFGPGKNGLFEILKSSKSASGQTFTGSLQNANGSLSFKTMGFTVQCSGLALEGGKIETDKEALVKVKLSGCVAFNLLHEEVKGCVVSNEKSILISAIVLPIRHEKERYLWFQQDGGSLLVLRFQSGLGCPLPNLELDGTAVALVKEKEAVIHLITFSEAVQKLLGAEILFGTHLGFLDGSWTLQLSGVHLGCSWGIV